LNIVNDVILTNNYFTRKKRLQFLTESCKNVAKIRSG